MDKQTFYFDDEEEGLSRSTSHPGFVSRFTEEFYYDVLDDFSPFGNDDGADTLFELQDWYRKTKGKKDIMQWLFKYIDGMGFKYKSQAVSELVVTPEDIAELNAEDPFCIPALNNCIIAAAFGQHKISGQLDSRLKQAAIVSFKRQAIVAVADNETYSSDFLERYKKMESDLAAVS